VIEAILIADDDEAFCRACIRGLREQHKAVVARTLDEAVVAARQLSFRSLDLAIVDLRLGADDGIDLVRTLRRQYASATIVLVSAYLSVSHTEHAIRAGADTVMFKPFTWKELWLRIDALGDSEASAAAERGHLETPSIGRVEWEHINRVLVDSGGNVSLAARRLGIHRQSLQRKLRRFAPRG
jgi:two-component system response regulator RegA